MICKGPWSDTDEYHSPSQVGNLLRATPTRAMMTPFTIKFKMPRLCFSSCKYVKMVNNMEGCKCTGIVFPKLAMTQNHLAKLGKTDSTPDLMNKNL